MRQPTRRWVIAVVIATWLGLSVALCAWILLGTAERGSSGTFKLVATVAMALGIVVCFAGMVAMPRRQGEFGMRTIRALAMVLGGLTLFSLYFVHHRGQTMYLEDQAEARHFIERRLAVADELHRATGNWPADQREFLGDEQLPRMLRFNQFYYRPAQPDGFELYINIDFDGGWHLTHEQRDWRRAT